MRNESRSKSQRAEDDTWSKWPETTTVKILEGNIKERLTLSIESVMGARSYLRRPAKPARRHYHPSLCANLYLGRCRRNYYRSHCGQVGRQSRRSYLSRLLRKISFEFVT